MTERKRERENDRRHRSPISVMKWDIIAGPEAMKRIIKEYCKHLYAHKFDNLEEVNQFLKKHKLQDTCKMKLTIGTVLQPLKKWNL